MSHCTQTLLDIKLYSTVCLPCMSRYTKPLLDIKLYYMSSLHVPLYSAFPRYPTACPTVPRLSCVPLYNLLHTESLCTLSLLCPPYTPTPNCTLLCQVPCTLYCGAAAIHKSIFKVFFTRGWGAAWALGRPGSLPPSLSLSSVASPLPLPLPPLKARRTPYPSPPPTHSRWQTTASQTMWRCFYRKRERVTRLCRESGPLRQSSGSAKDAAAAGGWWGGSIPATGLSSLPFHTTHTSRLVLWCSFT
jgi:hypothetical protein